jgi:hypothetical protein
LTVRTAVFAAIPARGPCAEPFRHLAGASRDIDKITSVLATGGQHLGDIVYWTLAEARIDRSTLENIWNAAQLSPAMLPEPPTAEKALKTAAREAAVGQPERLIRLGLESENEIAFAVVRETKHEDGSVSYTQETRVVLDRATERVTTDAAGHDVAAVIAARFGELRSTHTPDDIRRSMMKVLDSCAAITLREHGGVVWVPAPYAEIVRRLQSAVERIDTSKLYILPVHASADANRTRARRRREPAAGGRAPDRVVLRCRVRHPRLERAHRLHDRRADAAARPRDRRTSQLRPRRATRRAARCADSSMRSGPEPAALTKIECAKAHHETHHGARKHNARHRDFLAMTGGC